MGSSASRPPAADALTGTWPLRSMPLDPRGGTRSNRLRRLRRCVATGIRSTMTAGTRGCGTWAKQGRRNRPLLDRWTRDGAHLAGRPGVLLEHDLTQSYGGCKQPLTESGNVLSGPRYEGREAQLTGHKRRDSGSRAPRALSSPALAGDRVQPGVQLTLWEGEQRGVFTNSDSRFLWETTPDVGSTPYKELPRVRRIAQASSLGGGQLQNGLAATGGGSMNHPPCLSCRIAQPWRP